MLTILSINLLILRPYFYALIVFEFHAKHDSFSDFVYMHSGITAFILCMNTENEDVLYLSEVKCSNLVNHTLSEKIHNKKCHALSSRTLSFNC